MSRKARNAITGQEQEEVPTVVVMPVVCPNKECGSSNRSTASYTHIDSSGQIEGQAYTRVVWYYATCLDCGQRYRVKSYHNIPSEELEGTPIPAHCFGL